ncbi:MAG: hypothetical protein IPI60_17560 [Saprospiraceae bacterium]|nr:hypothetical protein [Saprospiraceae bacterium]
MEKLEKVFFYHLEKAIKSYRQFAQSQLKKTAFTLQWISGCCENLTRQAQYKPDCYAQKGFSRQSFHYKDDFRLWKKDGIIVPGHTGF